MNEPKMSLQTPRARVGLHTQRALVVPCACVGCQVAPIVTGRHNTLTTDLAAVRVAATVDGFMQAETVCARKAPTTQRTTVITRRRGARV